MLPFAAALLPLITLSLADQFLQYGIWVYLLVFLVITIASTIAGGSIPDNTFLILTGAVAMDNQLPLEWLFVVAFVGGVTGYEINYWSGRLFGLAICRGICPGVLHDRNIMRARELMDRYGAVSLILSRFMPVLNLPSFIAGMNGVDYRRYLGFNLISSAVWCGSLLLVGYFIGSIPLVNEYLNYITDFFFIILAAAIAITVVLFVRDYMRQNRNYLIKQESPPGS